MATDTPVLTNAEWLRLTGELSDVDLLQLWTLRTLGSSQASQGGDAATHGELLNTVHESHTDEVCEHCMSHLDGPKTLGPSNPACEGRWCSHATLDWLSSPCGDPDED